MYYYLCLNLFDINNHDNCFMRRLKIMNLKDSYNDILSDSKYWIRYDNKIWQDITVESMLNDIDKCQSFIYSLLMREGGTFLNSKYLRITKARAQHTVSSFLLGILLKEMLNIDMKALPRPTGNYHTSFIYFWTLTSLYHDMAYEIENRSKNMYLKCNTIEDFEREYDIKYSLLKKSNYSELFRQYYKYRIEYGNGVADSANSHKIDHGICCGILLYNALMEKYYSYHSEPKAKYDFSEEWKYSKNFPEYALVISETIARHNIWVSNEKTKDIYEKYNLNKLITDSFVKDEIKFGKSENLLLLLGIVDTIDPIKAFQKDDKCSILADIDISFKVKKKEFSLSSDEYINKKLFKKWKCLQDWLNIEVELKDTSTLMFQIIKDADLLLTA